MSRVASRIGLWLAVATAAALLAPAVAPLDPTLHAAGNACAAGCIVGAFVFVLLARRWISVAALAGKAGRRRLGARSVVLTAKSAQEEAVWRGLVLGGLVDPLGRLGAITASTVTFAAAHVPGQGRAAAAHLVTGSAFGLVYLATGRLLAAVAAHCTYNVLVGAAPSTRADMSGSDNGFRRAPVVASEPPSRPGNPMPAPPTAPPVARLEGVVKSFGRVSALDGVDLELRRGEILALLGPNGAGKSTAVALLLGLRRADAGHATLFGLDPGRAAARRRVGAVLQEVSFPPGLRVRDTVELVRAHFPRTPPPSDVLATLELETLEERYAGGLSGGQRRRLAVALALAGRPDALFLDEPTAGMDATARRRLLADLGRFAANGGAVLLTTQQLAEAEEIATRIVLLSHGRVVLEGTVPEVRARAGRARITFRADALRDLPRTVAVETRGGRHVVYVEDADAFVAALVRSGMRFSDLEVVPVSLEDAFVALTAEEGP